MALNLRKINANDRIIDWIDIINANFDEILANGGGPIGLQGIQGIQGIQGLPGLQGIQGLQGQNGSQWFIGNSDPNTLDPTNTIYNAVDNDLFIDTSSTDIYKFDTSIPLPNSWVLVGSAIISSFFERSNNGAPEVIFNKTKTDSLILSDIAYTSATPPPNPFNSKFRVSSSFNQMQLVYNDGSTDYNATSMIFHVANSSGLSSISAPILSINGSNGLSFNSTGNITMNSNDLIFNITDSIEINSNSIEIITNDDLDLNIGQGLNMASNNLEIDVSQNAIIQVSNNLNIESTNYFNTFNNGVINGEELEINLNNAGNLTINNVDSIVNSSNSLNLNVSGNTMSMTNASTMFNSTDFMVNSTNSSQMFGSTAVLLVSQTSSLAITPTVVSLSSFGGLNISAMNKTIFNSVDNIEMNSPKLILNTKGTIPSNSSSSDAQFICNDVFIGSLENDLVIKYESNMIGTGGRIRHTYSGNTGGVFAEFEVDNDNNRIGYDVGFSEFFIEKANNILLQTINGAVLNSSSGLTTLDIQQVNTSGEILNLNWVTNNAPQNAPYIKFENNSVFKSDIVVNALNNGVDFNNVNVFAPSDQNLKSEIVETSKSINDIMSIPIKDFKWKNTTILETGVIAQEIKTLFPNFVNDNTEYNTSKELEVGDEGYKYLSVDYVKFIPLLIKAVQDLKNQLDAK